MRLAAFLTSAAVLLVACGGSGSVAPTEPPAPPSGVRTLPGAATAAAGPAVPAIEYVPVFADLRTGGPGLPAAPLSVSAAIVALAPNATVGGVNALLQRLGATVVGGIPAPAGSGAIVALQIPGGTHATMTAALAVLSAAPEVRTAVADIAIGITRVGRSGDIGVGWDWTLARFPGDPSSSTFAHAAMRIPQLWNLRNQVEAVATVPVGQLDLGFPAHVELVGVITSGSTEVAPPLNHGTEVGSVIAARPDNDIGIDGIAPFARLAIRPVNTNAADGTTTAGASTWGLIGLLESQPNLRVVNLSLAYNWSLYTPPINSDTDLAAQERARKDGEILGQALDQLELARGGVPVFVAAAGNDRGRNARFASHFNNLALTHAAFIVVQSDSVLPTNAPPVQFTPSVFSNVFGDVTAPGSQIPVATGTAAYKRTSGTSFAAPAVSAIVAWLYALEPALPRATRAANPLKNLLIDTRNTAVVGRAFVDGFAAAMALDSATASSRVLRRLLDVDDGTLDGNARRDPFTGAIVPQVNVREDDTIDMADFRRWRDLVLQVDFGLATDLDGAANSPKKDANGDGFATNDFEDFPQADFNGDGQLTRTARRALPGFLRTRGPLTDLEVFQSLFDDPDYAAADLPDLISSGDIHLSPDACPIGATGRVRMQVTRLSGGFARERIFTAAGERYVLTLPVSTVAEDYRVTVARLDAGGTVLASRQHTVSIAVGGDRAAQLPCDQPPRVLTISLQSAVVGQFYVATLTAENVPGTPTWSVTDGALPGGLALNAATGVISGTPTTVGTGRFSVRVTGTTSTGAIASAPQALVLEVLSSTIVRTYSGTTLTTVSNSSPVNRTCELRTLRTTISGSSFDLAVVAPGGSSPECTSFTTVQPGSFISIAPDGSFQRTAQLGSFNVETWTGVLSDGSLTLRYQQARALPGTLTPDPSNIIFRIDFAGAVN